MITEDYVNFETAKLLKEKGFDRKCSRVWVEQANHEPIRFAMSAFVEGEEIANKETVDAAMDYANEYMFKEPCIDAYLCPTVQMAMKWLREKHNIFISIIFCTYPREKKVTWTPEINTFDSAFPDSAIEYNSYEEAAEAAINYCLANLL